MPNNNRSDLVTVLWIAVSALLISILFSLCPLTRQEHDYFKKMITFLGKGEASCIAFARGRNVIVATDDRTARWQCTNSKVPVTGTIGILKASVQDGSLTLECANEVLASMITAGFYSPVNSISDILYKNIKFGFGRIPKHGIAKCNRPLRPCCLGIRQPAEHTITQKNKGSE